MTKYIKAMEEDNGYELFILFPPPLNFLLIPLILVCPSESMSKKISKSIEYLSFWAENLVLIILHFLYFIALDGLIYIKTFFKLY